MPSESNKRLAKNTIMLYVRMLFLMIVGLYTSRVVLHALGINDFGIYNAVGGFIAMFSMISNSLTAAIGRFITFILGEGDKEKLHKVFCTSIIIQLAIAAIIFVLVELFGVWFLNTKMTIPAERYVAANWVLQLSLISFVINLLSVPYNAAIVAHEKMSAFAYIGIFEGLTNLVIALLLSYSPTDKLIFYSVLMCLAALSVRIIYTVYCKRHFEECFFQWLFDRELFKQMFGFAGWNFVGSISGLMRSQGINILFNVYNGPAVNAARGLANQVNSAVTKFSSNFYMAVQPQITKNYASGDNDESASLALRSSRLAFCMLIILAIPVIFETDFLLRIWLKEVPKHTASFVQIIIFYSLFESLSQPLIQLMLATGDIKKYQLVVGGINLANFPVAWLLLAMGFSPEIAQSSVIIFTFLALAARLHMLKGMTGFPAGLFVRETVIRCIVLLLLCSILPFMITLFFEPGWQRFCFNLFLTEGIAVALVLFVGMTTSERSFALSKVKRVIRK